METPAVVSTKSLRDDEMNRTEYLGKPIEDVERDRGFTWYIEIKDRPLLIKNQDHSKIVDALLSFIDGKELKILKTDDGRVVEVIDLAYPDIEANLRLLENKKGLFWEEDTEMCFALLGEDFLSYVFPNMIMFSANEANANKMAQLLKERGLEYFGPEPIDNFSEESGNEDTKPRKLGRNEPCHCGSRRKYKKCCLEEDMKKHGHAIKA